MDDNGFVQNLLDGKPVGKKYLKRKTVVSKQRRQIACVIGVGGLPRVVMGKGIGKGVFCCAGALGAAVNVKSKKPTGVGKSRYVGGHQDTRGHLMETNDSVDLVVFPVYPCHCLGIAA